VSASLVFRMMLVENTYNFFIERKDAKTQRPCNSLRLCVFAFNSIGSSIMLVLFLLVSYLPVTAQTPIHLNFQASHKDQEILNELSFPTSFVEKDSVQNTLYQLLQALRQKGYYAASVDHTNFQDSIVVATISIGDLYGEFLIQNGNIPTPIWRSSNMELYANRRLNFSQLEEAKEVLLTYCENKGYPFATVWLEDIQILDKEIQASLNWQSGPLMTIGNLTVEGDQEIISSTYLENHLGLKSGDLYNKEQLEKAYTKLQELPFLKSTRIPTALFEDDQANLYFFLEPQKANRFDFLIGVLPNNQQTGKPLITADIDADFYNQFGRGEQLQIQFEQLRPETQQLQLGLTYPYILNTPLGIDLDFELYKRDTTYRDVNWQIGVQYQFASNHYLKAFSRSLSTTLLSINQNQIIQEQQLPNNVDTRYTAFGLTYHQEQLDFRLNPRKGWIIDFTGSAGNRSIKKNENITSISNPNEPETSLENLYEAFEPKNFQYQLEGHLSTFLPIQKRSTIQFSLQAASILSPQTLFNNEQFRIGGAQSLRGFDEQSVFASSYALGTLAYRYLIGRRNYLQVFNDLAWVKSSNTNEQTEDWLLGIGAGMAFETQAGVFGISYALGKSTGTPFDFKRAKIHFGFVNEF